MGYILPAGFEQYSQYHLRSMREDSNPLRTKQIEPTGKAFLLEFSNTAAFQKETYNSKKKEALDSKKIDELYAEMTGTGLRFNQKI